MKYVITIEDGNSIEQPNQASIIIKGVKSLVHKWEREGVIDNACSVTQK